MLKFRRFRFSIFVICAIAATVSNLPLSSANNSKIPLTAQMTINPAEMTQIIKNVTLIAKEEKLPPLGIPNKSDRDLGFASVFLRLENPQQKDVAITIQNIEIRNADNGEKQNFTYSSQNMTLKPLENAEIAFHLTNKIGYIGQDRVKAIVTYQIGEMVDFIESDVVEVER